MTKRSRIDHHLGFQMIKRFRIDRHLGSQLNLDLTCLLELHHAFDIHNHHGQDELHELHKPCMIQMDPMNLSTDVIYGIARNGEFMIQLGFTTKHDLDDPMNSSHELVTKISNNRDSMIQLEFHNQS